MRALVIGDHEILTAKISEIIRRSGLDYPTVDVARLATVGGVSGINHELTVVVLPSDPERGEEVLGAIRNATPSILLAVGPTNDAKSVLRASARRR